MRRYQDRAIVIAVCAIGAVYALLSAPALILTPDSADYLSGAAVRSLGYPLFLMITGVRGATILQPVLFSLALACLGYEVLAATSSASLAVAVVVSSMVNPYLVEYHASVLTESMAMTMLVLTLAAIGRFVRAPSWPAAWWAGALAGAGATIRPTAYALIPVICVMLALAARHLPNKRIVIAAALLPMLALPLTERVVAGAIHGDQMTSLAGRVLFAKAAMVDAAPTPAAPTDAVRGSFEEALDVTYAPIRELIESAPTRDVREVLTLYYEGCLQWTCVDPLRRESGLKEPDVDDVAREVGLARLERAPLRYLALWALNYRALWTAYPARHPDTAPILNAYVAARRPLPFEAEVFAPQGHYPFTVEPYPPASLLRVAVLLAGLGTAALAVFVLVAAATDRTIPAPLSLAGLAALAVHSGLLFTSALGIGTARITVSFLPSIMLALLLTGWWLLARLRRPDRMIRQ